MTSRVCRRPIATKLSRVTVAARLDSGHLGELWKSLYPVIRALGAPATLDVARGAFCPFLGLWLANVGQGFSNLLVYPRVDGDNYL